MSYVIHAIYEGGVFRPIEPVDLPERARVEFEPRVLDEGPPRVPFCNPQSLDELAAQQGVSPVFDLEQISALWPADDDPGKLLQHIQRERDARRSLLREKRT